MRRRFFLTIAVSAIQFCFAAVSIASDLNSPESLSEFSLIQSTGENVANGTLMSFNYPTLTNSGSIVVPNHYSNYTLAFEKIDQSGNSQLLAPIYGVGNVGCPITQTNCQAYKSIYSSSTSPSGEYFYYVIYGSYYQNGSSTVYIHRVNNGRLETDILYDALNDDYLDIQVKVNNHGNAVLSLQKKNGLLDFYYIQKSGDRRLLALNQLAPRSIAINDLDTAYFIRINGNSFGEVLSVDTVGTSKVVGQTTTSFMDARRTFDDLHATNLTEPAFPEGVVYYRKDWNQVARSGDINVITTHDMGYNLGDFRVNAIGEIVWSGTSIANANRGVVVKGTSVDTGKVIETGNSISGKFAARVGNPTINDSGAIAFNIMDERSRFHLFTSAKPQRLCKVGDKGKEVAFYSQADSAWSQDPYANIKSETVRNYGCYLSSVAMIMNFYGLKSLDGAPVTPKNLNSDGYTHRKGSMYPNGIGYTISGAVRSAGMVELMRDAFVKQCEKQKPYLACEQESKSVVSYKKQIDRFTADEEKLVEDEICKGNPVVLKLLKNGTTNKFHYVIAHQYSNLNGKSEITVHDPASINGRNVSLLSLSKNYSKVVGLRYFRPEADPAMIFINTSTNLHFIISNPANKKLGFDPLTQTMHNAIPDGEYSQDSVNTPGADGYADMTLMQSRTYTQMNNVANGQYALRVYGLESGPYTIEIYNQDLDGFGNDSYFYSGTIRKGDIKDLIFRHTDKSAVRRSLPLQIKNAVMIKQFSNELGSQIMLHGSLNKLISMKENFKLNIGGVNGVSFEIPKSHFKKVSVDKFNSVWTHTRRDLQVVLESNGHFVVHGYSKELNALSQAKWSQILIDIDGLYFSTVIDLNCVNKLCSNKRK